MKESTAIGDHLRKQRIERLKRGLREAATLLSVSPAYVTDLEKGNRTPSEELMNRIAEIYDVPIEELRSGWSRPSPIVSDIATRNPLTAAKVPQLLEIAQHLNATQWDRLIGYARRLAEAKARK